MSNTYPLTVRYELTDGWMDTLVEMAGYGIGYWATKAESDDKGNYTVWWEDSGTHRKTLTRGALARATQRIIDPTDTAGWGPTTCAAVAAAVLDDGDTDADVADAIIQCAIFGKPIYG